MPEPRDEERIEMSPEEAVRKIEHATSNTRALRVRTEGLTLVLWAIIMAASYLTIAVPFGGGTGELRPPPDFNDSENETVRELLENRSPGRDRGDRGPPATQFFLSRVAPSIWYLVGAVVTVGIWNSASLSFQTGVSTKRILLVLGGWVAVFFAATIFLTYVEGPRPRSWHLLAWGTVIALFALTNPLRFTTKGRVAAGVMALGALAFAAYAAWAGLGPRDTVFLSGLALGVPGLLAGLWLLFRG